MTQQRIVNSLTATVALLTLAIGAGAFVLSYDALKQTGQAGGIPPALAWLWPLLIDAPLIVFTIALLVAQLTRSGGKLWGGLVGLYTLLTIGFNLSHAQPSPLGWTVAVVAPTGLLLTTEALRHLAKTIIQRQAMVETLAELGQRIDQGRSELERIERQKERAAAELAAQQTELKAGKIEQNAASVQEMNAAKAAKIETRRGQVLDLLRQQLSQDEIAERLSVSVRTVRNDIRQLNGAAQSARGLTQ